MMGTPVTLQTFLSLDGVMQAPGGPDEDTSSGFPHGGWTFPYADEQFGEVVADWFRAGEGYLLGRRTYDIFASYWPNVPDPEEPPVAQMLNSLPKYVASRTPELRLEWRNSAQLGADVVAEVATLKQREPQRPGGELQIHGSGDFAQTLHGAGLIDEYRLFIYPVVLGTGKRLFPEGSTPTAMKLVNSTVTASGITIQTYRPAGKPTYGSFAADA
jgi:dihydrofolate reductase